jgi:hypothetical protein
MARLFVGGTEIPRERRHDLEWSSVVPGGDDRCSWNMTCSDAAVVFEGTLPDQLIEVRVTGTEVIDILWIGWLRKPRLRVEEGIFTEVVFEAEGYQYSGLVEPFEEHVKYGPASVGSSSLDKVVTTDVTDAMSHARSQKTPAITGEKFLSGAGNFEEDSESFFGKTAVDVWNTANQILGYFANPLYWQVYAIDGEPTLELFPHGGTPDYFEDGKAKSLDVEFDANDVVWRVVAAFGGTQTYVADDPPAIATTYTKSKVLNLETEARSLNNVTNVADGAVAQLNVVRITGGTIVIDKPIRARYCITDLPPEYLRAGRMIDVTIPEEAAPYHTDQPEVGGPISGFLYIKRCSYSEESCEASLSPSAYTDEARALRMIPFQNSPALTWGIAFGTFNTPPRYDKLYPEGTSTIPQRTNPNTEPIIGSMVPTGYKTDSLHDYGPSGAIVDPRSIPKNAAAANFIIEGKRDASNNLTIITDTASLANEVAAFQPIPEMVVERIVLYSPISGSITLRFHKFNRLTETTTNNFIGPASLTSEQYSETVITSGDPAPGDTDNRSIIAHGDWIIVEVEGDATSITQVGVGIIGRKIVESIAPPQAGPGWVERPASPSYPHDALW